MRLSPKVHHVCLGWSGQPHKVDHVCLPFPMLPLSYRPVGESNDKFPAKRLLSFGRGAPVNTVAVTSVAR